VEAITKPVDMKIEEFPQAEIADRNKIVHSFSIRADVKHHDILVFEYLKGGIR